MTPCDLGKCTRDATCVVTVAEIKADAFAAISKRGNACAEHAGELAVMLQSDVLAVLLRAVGRFRG